MEGEQNDVFEELKTLVDEAFPDLRCLRCGNDSFLLASDVNALGAGQPGTFSVLSLHSNLAGARRPVLTLACSRCGHLEHHVVGLLEKASKPIMNERVDG